MRKYLIAFSFLLVILFSDAQYSWRPKACLPAAARDGDAAFALGNFGYLVCATTIANPTLNEVWKYDATTNIWTQLNNFPTARTCPAVFVINGIAYVGLGMDAGGNYLTDFYQYNAALDSWTPIANFPGVGRYLAMTFVVGGKGYVGCGKGSTQYNDFYQYDPGSNTWTAQANFPGAPRQGGAGFSLGNNGFFVCGYDGSFYSDVYKFSPASNAWTQMNSFTGPARSSFGFFTINDTFYLAAGVGVGTRFDDCWRYNAGSDNWTQMASFTCIAPPRSTLYGFTINGHGYIPVGDHGNGTLASDLLEFGPDDASFTTRVHVLGNDTAYCSSFSRDLSTGNSCTKWSTGATGAQITVTTPGTYWARFADSCGMVSDTITIAQGAPVTTFSGDTSYCGNFSRVLSTGVASTVWSNGATGAQITVTTPGTYIAQVADACGTVADTIVITQKATPTINFGTDTFLCYGQTLKLDATNSNSSYHWQDNTFNPIYTVTTSGVYSVTITGTSGCFAADTITVNYAWEAPQPDLGRDLQICGDSTVLHVGIPNARYLWNDNSTDSTYTVNTSGIYSVTVTDGCGTGTASVNVSIHPDDCALLIPTGFSPNGDGKNDLFHAVSHCSTSRFNMLVYNRWGELVFQTGDVTEGWDGVFHNKPQPMGVYVYYIEYFNNCENKLKKISGNVTLVR